MRKHYFQWQKIKVGFENSHVICDLELTKNVPLSKLSISSCKSPSINIILRFASVGEPSIIAGPLSSRAISDHTRAHIHIILLQTKFAVSAFPLSFILFRVQPPAQVHRGRERRKRRGEIEKAMFVEDATIFTAVSFTKTGIGSSSDRVNECGP